MLIKLGILGYTARIYLKVPLLIERYKFERRSCKLDVRGSVHHSTIHKEKSNKMQQRIIISLFHIYMKLNMFRVTHRPLSRAKTALAASGFAYVEVRWTCSWWTFLGTVPDHQLHVQQPSTYEKPEAASAVLGS